MVVEARGGLGTPRGGEQPPATMTAPANPYMNAFAFILNVTSSVVIIFVNKQLMRPAEVGGAGFTYGKWHRCCA